MDSDKNDLEMMADAIENTETNKQEIENEIIDHRKSTINFNAPKIFATPDRDERAKQTKFWNKDVYVRFAQFSFIASSPILILIILTVQKDKHKDVDLSRMIGIGIQIMYITYFGGVAYFFWTGARSSKDRYLFRIWTRSEPVPGWASMNIATHQQIYEFEAIQSISEFSAIDGGVPSFMLSTLGPFTWAIVAMHFAAELQYNDVIFQWDVADVCEIIGVCGLVMIGIFGLDPYNPAMKKFHYLGAGCGVGTIAGYVLQSYSLSKKNDWWWQLAFALLIGGTAVAFFVLWQLSNKKTEEYQVGLREKYKSKDPTKDELVAIKRYITKLSLLNVTFEGVFLFLGATSLAIWMMNYSRSCSLGCAGEFEQ